MSRLRVRALSFHKDCPMSQRIELTLPSMTCGHCVKTVTRTAQRLDPQAQVQADLGSHKVVFETGVPRERLVEALAEEGYPASDPR
jgi:copper chaperone